jgi:hypothetical protein
MRVIHQTIQFGVGEGCIDTFRSGIQLAEWTKHSMLSAIAVTALTTSTTTYQPTTHTTYNISDSVMQGKLDYPPL